MTRIISRSLLFGGLLGLLVGCGDVLPDGSGGASIAGTVSAPTGGDVAGTEIYACFNNEPQCDQLALTTVRQSGRSAAYALGSLPNGSYGVYALKDAGNVGNDLYGYYGRLSGDLLVTPPAKNIDIDMIELVSSAQIRALPAALRQAVSQSN